MAAGGITCKYPPTTPHLFISKSSSSSSSSSSSFTTGTSLAILSQRKKKLISNNQTAGKLPAIQMMRSQSLLIGKAQRWWHKGLHHNMKEITSAQHLADSLLNAGDQLVVVDFFSPACGGCKALHPKICQFAEMNPDVQFLQVNHEEHKSMSYTLNVHVLPFFRFYRGAHGRLCSFSCTNATIKKFRDALAKHTTERCSLGPTKGLEEAELLALAANRDLSFNYTPTNPAPLVLEPAPAYTKDSLPLKPIKESQEKTTLVTATGS